MNLHVLVNTFTATLGSVFADWNRTEGPSAETWDLFLSRMAPLCKGSFLHPVLLPHGGAFGNTWGI